MQALLTVEDLSIAGADRVLVSGLNFSVKQGELLAVFGHSGAGKSLAMLSLLGMLPKLSVGGRAYFAGEALPIINAKDKRWYTIRQRIGYVFQDPKHTFNPLHSTGTAFAKVLKSQGIAKKYHRTRTLELLAQVKLPSPESFLQRYPHQLSGGEAQRIAIALALAGNPQLIIADEPTSSLDEALKADMVALLRTIASERAVIVISHDTEYVLPVSDRCLVLWAGKVLADTVYSSVGLERYLSADLGKPSSFDDNQPVLLKINKLSLAYQRGFLVPAVPVLDGFSMNIRQGQIVGLLGASGSGKSSLAKAITRLDDTLLVRGQIFFGQAKQSVLTLNKHQLRAYRPKVIWVMQDVAGSLSPYLTIRRILLEGSLTLDGVDEFLDLLGLPSDVLGRYPHELSGGECVRVCLLRALLAKPKLLILDEPTAMLDGQTTRQVVALLRHINQTLGIAMLLISHDKHVAMALCHRLTFLKDKTANF